MPRVNQLTVRCENRPGTLAQIAAVLGEVDVNILGFLLTTSGTKGQVKLIVNDVKKAKEALEDAQLLYSEQIVLHAKTCKCAWSPWALCCNACRKKNQHHFGRSNDREGLKESKCSAGGLAPRQGTSHIPEHRFGSVI